jgi:Mg2+ and Co2+ transporter CorA
VRQPRRPTSTRVVCDPMQLVVLAPSAPPLVMPATPIHIDSSDSGTLAWLDLDRTEATELTRLVPEVPGPVARELEDASRLPQIRERGGLRWLSLLAVSDMRGARGLADLDVLFGPGFMVTIHTGDRPILQRLRDPVKWRRRLTAPLSRAALENLLYAILDGYDDLIDDAEAQVERLSGDSPGVDHRSVPAQLLNLRRQMMAVRGQLSGQRELFAHLARSGSGSPPDGAWWINDRLDTAISGAREAADYALAGVWSTRQASHSRSRQLGMILLAAWATWLGLVAITRLADLDGPSAIDPLWYAGGLLAVITVLALAALGSRRWR